MDPIWHGHLCSGLYLLLMHDPSRSVKSIHSLILLIIRPQIHSKITPYLLGKTWFNRQILILLSWIFLSKFQLKISKLCVSFDNNLHFVYRLSECFDITMYILKLWWSIVIFQKLHSIVFTKSLWDSTCVTLWWKCHMTLPYYIAVLQCDT